MKKWIHPETTATKFLCSCGHSIEVMSTIKDEEIRVEVCSNCHPFYTGEQRILKTGAVDKFYARMKKAEALKNK